jgi:2-(1,2-epoxy-1,2-dihydrophenyl)acetyl-CoA isomerase
VTLLLERDGGVATITLNRPSSLNSLSLELKDALIGALAEVRGDPAVRSVVLTGAGNAFCAGQDLREHAALLSTGDPAPLRTVAEHYNPITLGIADMPKPVVAAVRGIAAGAGAGFAFAADFRIGGPSTRFMLAFVQVGLAGDSGVTWTLPRLAGRARATELLLLGEPLTAASAFAAGLLSEVTETDDEVLGRAHELAAQLAAGPSVAYAQIKRCLSVGASGSLAETLAAEADAQATCGLTADHRNATAAFLTKQTPRFHGR